MSYGEGGQMGYPGEEESLLPSPVLPWDLGFLCGGAQLWSGQGSGPKMKGNISHENIPVLGLLKKSQHLIYFTTLPRQAYYHTTCFYYVTFSTE